MNGTVLAPHWCHTHTAWSIQPLQLRSPGEVMTCRRLGHDVRSEPVLSPGLKPKLSVRSLRALVESIGMSECVRAAGSPCLRSTPNKCVPCTSVFRLGEEVGALEQSERGRLLDAIREVLLCPGRDVRALHQGAHREGLRHRRARRVAAMSRPMIAHAPIRLHAIPDNKPCGYGCMPDWTAPMCRDAIAAQRDELVAALRLMVDAADLRADFFVKAQDGKSVIDHARTALAKVPR